VKAQMASRASSVTPLSQDRYTLELAATESVEDAIHELSRQGARVVSVNPIRTPELT
jgi:hypothetical protein